MPDTIGSNVASTSFGLAEIVAQQRQLIEAAAHATGCTAAVLLKTEAALAATWRVAHQFGLSTRADAMWIAARATDERSNDVARWQVRTRLRGSLAGELHGHGIGFWIVATSLIALGGDNSGMLVVGSDQGDRSLSDGQLHVLKSLASQIGLLSLIETRLRDAALDPGVGTDHSRLLESVAINANDAILIASVEPVGVSASRILYCNAAFTRTTGYTLDEILGKSPRILHGANTDRATAARIRNSLAAWKPVVAELLNYRKDGSEFWVEVSIVPVADEAGWYTHWVSVRRDITDRKAAGQVAVQAQIADFEKKALTTELQARKLVERRLFHAAFHDDLTKLPNRAFLMDRLAQTLIHGRSHRPDCLALLFLDLNRFKIVNDTLGHFVGDRLLVEVARLLSRCVEAGDLVARMGGDEFALLVDTSAAPDGAILVAERINQAMAEPIQLGQYKVPTSCSIGIVRLTTQYFEPEELLRDADIAMYRAKKDPKCSYALFADATYAQAVLALALQSDLRPAIEGGHFRLLYQPVFAAVSGRITALEGLIRWKHSRFGLLQPGVFVPIAEEAGLMRPLGRWVLQEASRQARLWRETYPKSTFRLNINVSAHELLDPGFVTDLVGAIEAVGILPSALELEITESVFLERSLLVLRVLEQLRALGVRLALDDFGTGYSSLGYLDSYPLDTLKIDRSFVAGMLEQSRTRAIIEAILRLADALDLDTIAEGVETEEQRSALVDMGCRNLQGFHLARPLTAADATELIKSDQL